MKWLIEQMDRAEADKDGARLFLFMNIFLLVLVIEVAAFVGALVEFWKLVI